MAVYFLNLKTFGRSSGGERGERRGLSRRRAHSR